MYSSIIISVLALGIGFVVHYEVVSKRFFTSTSGTNSRYSSRQRSGTAIKFLNPAAGCGLFGDRVASIDPVGVDIDGCGEICYLSVCIPALFLLQSIQLMLV